MITLDGTLAAPRAPARASGERALSASTGVLVVLSLFSAWLFGLYIVAFYSGTLWRGELARWNATLPRLYEPHTPLATLAIGLHFLAGGILLLLGTVQLFARVRSRRPALHRWIGRVYVASAFVAGAGGLAFIALKGTVGGWPMNLGFGLYGALVVLASAQAWRHARARDFARHRAWALRLFALAIGSWLYRMEYGFWKVLADTAGHTKDFSGPFDVFMAFFFYLPNLLVVEAFLRARAAPASAITRWGAAAVLAGAATFVAVGTWFFWRRYWGPPILAWLGL